jgi:hypothetical protein
MSQKIHRSKGLVAMVVLIGAGLTACFGKNDANIETYQTAKQSIKSAGTQAGDSNMGSLPPGHPEITQAASSVNAPMSRGEVPSAYAWSAPSGWSPDGRPASSMRLASFVIPGPTAGVKYSATIIALGGTAGGLIANANRWRQQVGLPLQDDGAILKSARSGQSALGEFKWFEFINDKSPENGMLVALVPAGDSTVFVKLMGPKDVLSQNRDKFSPEWC